MVSAIFTTPNPLENPERVAPQPRFERNVPDGTVASGKPAVFHFPLLGQSAWVGLQGSWVVWLSFGELSRSQLGEGVGHQAVQSAQWLQSLSELPRSHPLRQSQIYGRLHGSPFQLLVWRALTTIPFGQTASYREFATRIGRPKAARAVARAIGSNPLAWIIPCHRVIGSSGDLTGYRWGLPLKNRLLQWEQCDRNLINAWSDTPLPCLPTSSPLSR